MFDLGGVTMTDEVMIYKKKIEGRISDKPTWQKKCLTIEEAAAYSGIGRNKLRELATKKKCTFVLKIGNKIHIIREKLDEYTDRQHQL